MKTTLLVLFLLIPMTAPAGILLAEEKGGGGAGPQLSWKTRTDDKVGGPGWGAGAVGVVLGNITEQLSFAGIINQLWSYDGDFSTIGIPAHVVL